MNDLSGRCVNVVLAIEMGRGMGFLQHPVKIIANFNGRPLESDLVLPCESPVFNTELVWETEKKELRRVRSSNAPIRAEVQLIDNNQRKDRVGFMLLSPRCASIIPFDSKLEIPFKWQKLLGVAAEHKSCHPELYLSLTIRDLGANSQKLYATDISLDEDTQTVTEKPFVKDGEIVPIQYLPNGYIQIGGNECSEKYLLSIVVQVAYNLHLLLPEILVFNQNREKYYITFKIFGITIKSKPFCRDLHANIPMNEKIVIRISSQYDIIQTYLLNYCHIVVSFFCGHDKLGVTQLSVHTLLQNTPEEEFLIKLCTATTEQKCFFRFPSPHGIIPTGTNGRQPYIEVETSLKRTELSIPSMTASNVCSMESMNVASITSSNIEFTIQSNITLTSSKEKLDSKEISPGNTEVDLENKEMSPRSIGGNSESKEGSPRSVGGNSECKEGSPRESLDIGCGDDEDVKGEKEIENQPVKASGDQNELSPLELTNMQFSIIQKKAHSMQNLTARSEAISETCKSEDSVLRNVPPLSPGTYIKKTEELSKKIMVYQQYCLDIVLQNITLKKQIKSNKLCIKFKHPKASTVITVTSEIYNHVGEDIMFENTRCKMFFISTPEHIRKMVYAWPPKLIVADENDQNLTEELDVYTAMFLAKNRTECSYITECKALRTYEALAKVNILMYLQEYGLTAFPHPTDFDLLPPILDENIVIKELQDLQEWKEIQKIQFSADLKILEKQRIAIMKKEWSKKKKQLEDKLSKSVARCQSLSQELQAAVNAIRTKKALQQKESELNCLPSGSLQDSVENNIQKYSDYKKNEFIVAISKLERENEHLKEIINDQRQEMQQIWKTALTKEQTTSLLQQLRGLEEKFEEAQKAKTYFKEQWKKAVREIHDLRSEDQKQIQEQIHTQKIELSQLSLDTFLDGNGVSRKFEYAQSPFAMPESSTFGAFKWDPSDFSNGTYNLPNNT